MSTKKEVMEYVEKCADTGRFITAKTDLITTLPCGDVFSYDKDAGKLRIQVKTTYGPIDLNLTWEDVVYE